MSAMAGDLPGFEEATRAFFAGNRSRFDDLVESWPADVRDHAREMAAAAFEGAVGSGLASESLAPTKVARFI